MTQKPFCTNVQFIFSVQIILDAVLRTVTTLAVDTK